MAFGQPSTSVMQCDEVDLTVLAESLAWYRNENLRELQEVI